MVGWGEGVWGRGTVVNQDWISKRLTFSPFLSGWCEGGGVKARGRGSGRWLRDGGRGTDMADGWWKGSG
jgi:hypothetical protein